MKSRQLTYEKDGFYGVYYPNKKFTLKSIILMLGDSSDSMMVKCAAKYLHDLGCNVLAISPGPESRGFHSFELGCVERAQEFLALTGCGKVGIIGASETGTLALAAASVIPDITLTIALSPCDFVMEGFYRDGKDGARVRPGDNESMLTRNGKQLPYLPYAYRHPEYWQKIKEESKESGNTIAMRKMFDESERRHPITEEEKIKVEGIKGKLVLVGAEDDCMWDTCKYIRRMQLRLAKKPHECKHKALIYEYGTHFLIPERLLEMVVPAFSRSLAGLCFSSAKKHPRKCREARKDLDRRLSAIIRGW